VVDAGSSPLISDLLAQTREHDDKSRVLFSSPWGEGRFGRKNLTVQISYDECKTWKPLKAVHADNAAKAETSYSNLIVLPTAASAASTN
jgi:hypothetical protein